MEKLIEKSEILYLFESVYTIPNGDPFTGEQRYDDETQKALVSDVRIKRYVRDYFIEQNYLYPDKYEVFVFNDRSQVKEDGKSESGAAARMRSLWAKYYPKANTKDKIKLAEEVMKKCIDVRLFGGISTEKEVAVNITGPVQFALLNPSLNKCELKVHQNTSVFASDTDKSRGAIGTTTVVPYTINQIHGWINPYSAIKSGLTQADIKEMLKAIWDSVNNANTRSKSNQSSVLMLQLIYNNPTDKLYGADKLITLDSPDKEELQLRGLTDFTFNLNKLNEAVQSDKIKEVRYYTEIEALKHNIETLKNPKFKFTTL